MSDTTHRQSTDDGYLTFAFGDNLRMFSPPNGVSDEEFADLHPELADETAACREWWTTHLRDFHGIDEDEIAGFMLDNTYPLDYDAEGRLVQVPLGMKGERRPEWRIRGARDIHEIAHGRPALDDEPGSEGLPTPRPHTHDAQEALRAVIDNSWIPDFMKAAIYEMAWYLNAVGGGGVPTKLED